MSEIDRRTFLGGLGAASAFTIVPRRVLGGAGYTPPSDMILLAQVGCGTQAQRQVNMGLVKRTDLQFVAVVDPNRDSQDYVDWGPWGNRDDIREFLGDSRWGEGDTGIRAGREVARRIMETYYAKQGRPAHGIREYEDFREMLEQERDIQGVVNQFALAETKLAGFDLPDPIAMAYAIDPAVATERRELHCQVETQSAVTRGMVVMDLLGLTGHSPNATVVTAADGDRFLEMLRAAVS